MMKTEIFRSKIQNLVIIQLYSSNDFNNELTLIIIHLFNFSSPLSRLLRLFVLFDSLEPFVPKIAKYKGTHKLDMEVSKINCTVVVSEN